MTVNQAIEELKGLAISTRFSTREDLALSIAISALEKEKEPAPQEAETSSNNNNSISNDNTKLKECQEVINVAATELIEYYRDQLSEGEQKAWDLGIVHERINTMHDLLKEVTQCQ